MLKEKVVNKRLEINKYRKLMIHSFIHSLFQHLLSSCLGTLLGIRIIINLIEAHKFITGRNLSLNLFVHREGNTE